MAFLSNQSRDFLNEVLPQKITESSRSIIEDLVEIIENRTSRNISTLQELYDKYRDSTHFGWRPFIPVVRATAVKDHKKFIEFEDPEIALFCNELVYPIELSSPTNKLRIKRLIKAQEDLVVETIYHVLDVLTDFKNGIHNEESNNTVEDRITGLIVDHTKLVTIYYIDDSFYDLEKINFKIKQYITMLKNVKKIKKGTKSKIYQAHHQQQNYSFSYKDNQLLEWEILYKTLYHQLIEHWKVAKKEKKIWLKLPNDEIFPEKTDVYIGGTLRGWATVGAIILSGYEDSDEPNELMEKLISIYQKNKDIFLGDFISQNHFIFSLTRIIDTLYENILNQDLKTFLLD